MSAQQALCRPNGVLGMADELALGRFPNEAWAVRNSDHRELHHGALVTTILPFLAGQTTPGWARVRIRSRPVAAAFRKSQSELRQNAVEDGSGANTKFLGSQAQVLLRTLNILTGNG